MILIGAGGHAKVVFSLLESCGIELRAVFDSFTNEVFFKNHLVIKNYDPSIYPAEKILIAIGNNQIRYNISKTIIHQFGIIIHKSAVVDPTVLINIGTVILQGAVIQCESKIGKHCIINTKSSVDHECIIDDFVHISPGATLCGNVKVGLGSHIGAGATILPRIEIGRWCTIGAGAVVTKSVADFSVVVGVPGRTIKFKKNDFS